jgi:hypothetical protein
MIVSVLLSMVYAMARAMVGLLVLRGRGEPAKDIELLVLRHEVMGCVVRSVVRSLDQRPPVARLERTEVAGPGDTDIERADVLGGLIHEYRRAA